MAALGLEEKGAVVVTAGEGWHPGRRRAGRGAAEGALWAARLCHRAGARRHWHRLGAFHNGCRSWPRRAAGGARSPAAQGRRPRHGGGDHAEKRCARRLPRLSGGGAGAFGRSGAARPRAGRSTARSVPARSMWLCANCWRAPGPTAREIRSRCWRCRRTRSALPIRSVKTTSARASSPATANSSTRSPSAPPERRSAVHCSITVAVRMHAAGSLAIDRWQGEERVQLRLIDVAVS